MTASNFHSKRSAPAAVAGLDLARVAEVLARNACNVTDAAQDLGVPASDLRRLLWANPKLQDAVFEVVEARIDVAEKNIHEALHSEDSRTRLAPSFFTLRNSARAKRRGWITTAAALVDPSVNAAPPVFTWRPMPSELRTEEARKREEHRLAEVQRAQAEGHEVVQISWRNSADVDDADGGGDADGGTIERDGRRIRMPRYDNGRRDESDCVDAELTPPATMIEHAPATAEPVVVESEPDPAPGNVEPVVVESTADRYRHERVDKWIKDRLLNWPLGVCVRCRRPFSAGESWQEVANSAQVQARARFHQQLCYAEWRAEQEAEARRSLGLAG
jgi:hypothetical protein